MTKTHTDEQDMKGLKRIWIDETIEVAAAPERVHALLADIDGWAHWSPGLKRVRRQPGPLKVGTRFSMVLQVAPLPFPLPLPCKVLALGPDRIEWGGGLPGSVIRHRFELSPADGGRTRVRHVEYATNLLALLTLPAERFARAHDQRWSKAIAAQFAAR